MAQQNQKNIRKNQEGKVVKKINTTNPTSVEKITDEHIVTELNQKVKVLSDVSTVDGTLHKNEVVVVEARTSTGYKVIDNVGRFWFVKIADVSTNL